MVSVAPIRYLGLGLALCLGAAACGDEKKPRIIAHRALGIGDVGENRPRNVARLMSAGFGVEIDIRGDGRRPFTLGHLSPNGHTLREVFDEILAVWKPSFAGRILVLDVSNDSGDQVSDGIIDFLYEEMLGTELEQLEVIIQSSNEETLARMREAQRQESSRLRISLAITYWIAPEYTTAYWIDLVSTNVREIGSLPHPKPLLLFGIDTRASYREAVDSRNTVVGLLTDHPRRAAQF